MVESTAKLREEILALTGVDIMDGANQFKSTYAIMDELAAKWQDLTDIQQASVTELIAGKRQGNIVSSLMSNFDIARNALNTSLESSGSAMAEHAKWSESLEAQILKLKAAWQGLSQAFMSSNFLKAVLDGVIALVDGLTKLIDTIGTLPTILGAIGIGKLVKNLLLLKSDIKSFSTLIQAFGAIFPNLGMAFTGFFSALKGGQGIVAALTIGLKGLWGVIAAHPILAAVAAVGIACVAIDKYTESAKELANRVEEVTTKYEEQHDSLMKIKGSYDTSNEDSMISKYGQLSKGVNALGENVSLTADEYAEYQSIVDTIAGQIPSLVTGYNSQGDAILGCAGNVDKLREAYEKLIITQNNEVLDTGKDIFKDFQNDMKKSSMHYSTTITDDAGLTEVFEHYDTKHFEELQNLMNTNDGDLESAVNSLSSEQVARISDLLSEYGIERNLLGSGEKGWETWQEHIVRAVKENRAEIKDVLDDASNDLNAYAEDLGTVADAYFSNAFLGDYAHMSDKMQNVIGQITSGFGSEFYSQFLDDEKYATSEDKYKALTNYFDSLLNSFNSLSSVDAANFEAAFDLKTQFNGGEISYGEYVSSLKDAGKLVDRLGLDEDITSQLKLSLGLNEDGLVEEYETLLNRLTETSKDKISTGNIIGLESSEAKDLLNSLSAEELSVMMQIIPEIDADATKEEIQAVIDREMVIQGLSFDLSLEIEAAGIESLNTALAESVSATGLSSESINALKSRYADLESQGYDLSSMFEETSTGIRLNRQEFNKLEKEYSSQKLAEIDSDLAEMKSTYDELGEAIRNCDDPVEKSKLFSERQLLAERISEAATLASQYEGLTSAYNDWLSAEEAGQERDMYENVIKGFETVDDEISRGWIDDGTIEFLRLIKGDTLSAVATTKELKDAYDSLDDTIQHTTYSVRDFFTVDEDGNSTNDGVYNFLDAIGQMEEEKFGGKDVVQRDSDGNIIGFDFNIVGGDEAIAEALGISKELVQIMVRAADDAGFVVSMDGTYKQLADLQNEAKAATDYLNELFGGDYSFDFNTSNLDSLKTDLEEAKNLLNKEDENGKKVFWNDDGTFNFDADGATEAMTIVSALQAKLDNLSSEKYGIGLTVEDEEFEEPLENLQSYGQKVAVLNQLELNPKANAEDIEKIETELNEIAQEFDNLEDEKKIEIGLEIEDGVALTQENLDNLTKEQKIELGFVDENGNPLENVIDVIRQKIESGEIEIPTVLDIQANMDKNIERLADLAWLNSGLLSENQEETIRKKYNIEVEADEVDTTDVDKKVDNAVGKNGSAGITEKNIEIVAEIFGADNLEELSEKLNGLDNKTIEAVATVFGRIDVEKLKEVIDGLDDETIQVIAKALGSGDVTTLANIIESLDDKTVQAVAEAFGYDNVQDLKIAIRSLDDKTVKAVAEVFGITDVDSLKGAIDKLDGKTVKAIAKTIGKDGVDGLKSSIDSLKNKTITIKTNVIKNLSNAGEKASNKRTGSNLKVSEVNGTANVNGTAFKHGNWRTKKSYTALTGELGREIVVTPDNQWYTVGDSGAEFANIPRGSIVFNHKQTEELLANGKTTSGGGRAKALAYGTAFSSGSGGIGRASSKKKKAETITTTTTITKSKGNSSSDDSGGIGRSGTGTSSGSGTSGGSNKSSGSSSKSSSSSSANDDFEEVIDWIEVIIDRVERAIDKFEKQVNNIYKSWSSRNSALLDEIDEVENEISLQQQAYNKYMSAANEVGLSSEWQEKVRNGEVDISTIKDEALAEKIKEYQEW